MHAPKAGVLQLAVAAVAIPALWLWWHFLCYRKHHHSQNSQDHKRTPSKPPDNCSRASGNNDRHELPREPHYQQMQILLQRRVDDCKQVTPHLSPGRATLRVCGRMCLFTPSTSNRNIPTRICVQSVLAPSAAMSLSPPMPPLHPSPDHD